jgi:hypothetical protein
MGGLRLSTITARGLVPILQLVIWLGCGSKLAWGLLLVLNVSMLVAGLAIVFSSPGGGTVWGNVIVMILGCSALIAALTSRAMREHVSSQRRQQPVRPTGF